MREKKPREREKERDGWTVKAIKGFKIINASYHASKALYVSWCDFCRKVQAKYRHSQAASIVNAQNAIQTERSDGKHEKYTGETQNVLPMASKRKQACLSP
jgi:hypothetical protein